MSKLTRSAAAAIVGIAFVAMIAGPADGHVSNTMSITCSTVSGTFDHFAAGNHPIVWHVLVGAGAMQTVATTETPPAFVGSGIATADISALTTPLNGTTATVQAYATWPGGRSATQSAQLTCGVPIQVGGIEVTAPSVAPGAAPAVAPVAVPVQAAATFTG
jgi:hypothetical protein